MKTVLKVALGIVFGVTVLLVGLAGCGSETKTVTERTVTEKAEPQAPAKSKRQPAPSKGEADSAASGGGSITVPNVVGKNHQAAQDTMQAAGLYSLDEEDATGQGRLLIYDRNWEVMRQKPAPGSRVSEDTTVTLSSKKIGE